MVTKMLLEWEIRGKEDTRLEPGVFLDVQDGWEEGVKGDFSFVTYAPLLMARILPVGNYHDLICGIMAEKGDT